MADKKISDFTSATSIADGDLFEIENVGGNSRKVAASVVKSYAAWGDWTTLTMSGSSTIFSYTSCSSSAETFTAAAGDRIEIEAEVEKTIDTDIVVIMKVGSDGYFVALQSDNNVVVYRSTSSVNTSLSATGANTSYDYTGIHSVRFVVNVHAASNNYMHAVVNDQRIGQSGAATLNITNTNNNMVGTVDFHIKGTVKRARARLIS